MNKKNDVLILKNISCKAPNRELPILNKINLAVENGDFMILLGGNGAGKSTLIKLINRVYQISNGSIYFLDNPLKSYCHKDLMRLITSITQNPRDNLFADMTIAENAMLYEMRHHPLFDRKTKTRRLQEIQEYLSKFSSKIAQRLNMPVNLLSGGEQQILILALALRYPPKLLLLDEHTSALDPKTAAHMMEKTYELVVERNVTCVMTTHNLDFALRYGNKLIALKDGEIAQVLSPAEKDKVTRDELLRDCY